MGSLVPVHGCVVAEKNAAIRILRVAPPELQGQIRKVEFVTQHNAYARCRIYNRDPSRLAGLPDEACSFYAAGDPEARIVWANPCQTGDRFLCHELAHVHQYNQGWVDATVSPLRHWGRPPDRKLAE